jgi:acyl-[acyl-carrier-protein]-phospholipid O-acyltransferase/long-chain-fatty-acid--[acyl-carrier-protein] ligase
VADAPPPPAGNPLTSRTFLGLLVAQFLAAFNDQAIHASAMFFAINTQTLTEENAITLMPILFYAPWALFCTMAGYLADRYSKRRALVLWKVAEVGITGLAVVGFYLGRQSDPVLGSWLLLGCVFLMGTHSAFFVPAKYGIMPEILPKEQLSKGNGILESLSFLAVILGTVCGGVLSYLYQRQEVVIGLILFALAVVGAVASLLIRKVPAASPDRPFPAYVYGPIVTNVRTLAAVPALRLVLVGLVFFTFLVAFMRATVYMLGESQNPRWDELKTSLIVGTVALGIGIGSPLAGWLSGRRIELRLVLAGAAGMIASLAAAAYFIDAVPVLVGCIVLIGFCTGFYIVPLFTLLQHKAPKASKGDMIATSNCVNTTGAIAATLLFKLVVVGAHVVGLSPQVTDRRPVAAGDLTRLDLYRGRPVYFEVRRPDGTTVRGGAPADDRDRRTVRELVQDIVGQRPVGEVLEVHRAVGVRVPAGGPYQPVEVSAFTLAGVTHYDLVPAGEVPAADYDNRHLPRFLFLGAAVLTLLMLVAILRPVSRVRHERG